MPFRTSGIFKLQSTTIPQPLFGSWITAGLSVPISNLNSAVTITLGTMINSAGSYPQPGADAQQIFRADEDVWLVEPNGLNGEVAHIQSVSASANQVTLGPAQSNGGQWVTQYQHTSNTYGNGTWIIPKQVVNNLVVDFEDGGSGQWVYIGNQWNMTATYRRIAKLDKVASNSIPNTWSAADYYFGNPFDISELWILGASSGDLYNATLIYV